MKFGALAQSCQGAHSFGQYFDHASLETSGECVPGSLLELGDGFPGCLCSISKNDMRSERLIFNLQVVSNNFEKISWILIPALAADVDLA